jgi:phospholipase/lecithinase/hemolysin
MMTARSPFSPWVFVACLGVLSLPERTAAQSFDDIVVFGTSLSDSGNAFALRGRASTPPDYSLDPLLVPSAPYARGGHHFSNGATWIEQFARPLGLAGSVRPAFVGSSGATNFAVGAARARDDGVNFNLAHQVNAFLERSGGVVSPNALIVIEMGSNDVRDAFVVFASGGNGAPILQAAVTSVAFNIQRLYAAGARQFLVWTVPNVALTPAIRSLGPAAGALASQLTQLLNAGLAQALAQLSALPGIAFARLDAFQALIAINQNPSAFGLTNVTQACVTPNVPPFKCDQPDEYLFWDGIHPSRAGHAILAQLAATILLP